MTCEHGMPRVNGPAMWTTHCFVVVDFFNYFCYINNTYHFHWFSFLLSLRQIYYNQMDTQCRSSRVWWIMILPLLELLFVLPSSLHSGILNFQVFRYNTHLNTYMNNFHMLSTQLLYSVFGYRIAPYSRTCVYNRSKMMLVDWRLQCHCLHEPLLYFICLTFLST